PDRRYRRRRPVLADRGSRGRDGGVVACRGPVPGRRVRDQPAGRPGPERTRTRGRTGRRTGPAGGADARRRRFRGGDPGRGGHGSDRSDRLRGTGDPARMPTPGRPGPPVAAATVRPRRGMPAHRRRRAGTDRGPARGDRRRRHHRPDRGPVLHRHRAPAEGAGTMTTATETTRARVHAGPGAPSPATVAAVATARQAGRRRRHGVLAALTTAVVLALFLSLMVGHTFYSPSEVLGVLLGHDVPGASFTVSRLRLPRATMALAAGLAFGMGGVTFQTMLRNPLASPDIIGITSGASAAAMIGILVFGLSGPVLSAVAIVAGLAVALLVYLLSYRNGVAGTRLILIGIGFGAMFDSVISYLLGRAASWDLQEAMRWLTGSLNGSDWNQALLVLAALAVLGPVLLGQSRNLSLLGLGDEAAASLGVRTGRTRLIEGTAAVVLVAFATAATWPIAFVAFLSGPIAARMVGRTRSLVIPAALTGALLVLISDLAAQYLLGTRFPVGVVTGVLGAPYLLALIVRTNRTGGAL